MNINDLFTNILIFDTYSKNTELGSMIKIKQTIKNLEFSMTIMFET